MILIFIYFHGNDEGLGLKVYLFGKKIDYVMLVFKHLWNYFESLISIYLISFLQIDDNYD